MRLNVIVIQNKRNQDTEYDQSIKSQKLSWKFQMLYIDFKVTILDYATDLA